MFDEERKHFLPSLFTSGQPVINCIPSFPVLKNPCNLDPWGPYSSVIEATLLLDWHFLLSHPERLSLLRSMVVTPNSSYMFVAAAASLFSSQNYTPSTGLLLANTMRNIHSSLVAEKQKFLRDVSTATPDIPSQTSLNGTNSVNDCYYYI
jgi:hypothetical protein